jgi:DNA-directed RNA polymerase specialized sigma24 family protein
MTSVLMKPVGFVKRIVQETRAVAAEAATSPVDEAFAAKLDRAVAEIPAPDYEILLEWKSGLRYSEIADKKGVSKEVVLRSLARTYADLRMKTMPGEDPPGKDVVEVKCDQAA